MFIDEGEVRVRAGRGGDGCVSFHREKFVPRGGPDGGDGGRGGSIYLEGDRRLASLSDLMAQPSVAAKHGANGGSNRKNGRHASDVTLRVPVGTVVTDRGGARVWEILLDKETLCAARGGRGGGGNARFASSKFRLPRFALRGAPGEFRKLHLSLKLLSDIAIVGLPNCGKSTLLSAMTAARPKIADYPFTTLTPNLGVLLGADTRIVLADIPGLIAGAHDGRGLGNRFLKHIERAPAILVLLDASSNVADDFRLLRDEIRLYNPDIWDRPRIVAVNKADLVKHPPVKTWSKSLGGTPLVVSAKTGEGIEKLLKNIETLIGRTPRDAPLTPQVLDLQAGAFEIVKDGAGFRLLSSEWEELSTMVPRDHQEAFQWFQWKLKTDGVLRQMKRAGANPGDVLKVGPLEVPYEGG
ncbi:GTPase ObgE [bacterium]|nr:GTPase ObgE [bacterium]